MTSYNFEYDHLDRSTRNIRLLRILPYADTLDCVLETFSIDQCPGYTALSYVWGDDIASCEVRINQNVFLVRTNLWHVLHELKALRRTPDILDKCDRYFWIDAICINQADDLERGHQVNLMSDIFSRASRTIAWLGCEENNSNLAMRTLAARFCGPEDLSPEYAPAEAWTSIDAVFSRTYFERIWIVQEVLLAKRLLLLCGSSFCWWDDIIWFYSRWLSWSSQNFYIISDMPKMLIATKDFLRGRQDISDVQKLRYLLLNLRRRQCSDLRDKIYALLGLLSQPSRNQISLKADYTISLPELYLKAVAFFEPLPGEERSGMQAELMNVLQLSESTRQAVNVFSDVTSALSGVEKRLRQLTFRELNVAGFVEDRALLYLIMCEIERRFGIQLTSSGDSQNFNYPINQPLTGSSATDVATFLLLRKENVQNLIQLWQESAKLDSHLRRVVSYPIFQNRANKPKWKLYTEAVARAGLLDLMAVEEKARDIQGLMDRALLGSLSNLALYPWDTVDIESLRV